ncbi:hypothetical protein MUN46_009135 [Mesosutterella sp. AGMB02718]|uniref:Uncharacterized protein n=1 Tax=Mesosutterella faecium TaxID=2925194 RepID=A0ABT7IS14_9BURK|nr:hypothetical protein [Mesosutterella sp. AGMB02718]MDL2060096.1 hypothetical protein [Mesosutterella sp. AGMB02718]
MGKFTRFAVALAAAVLGTALLIGAAAALLFALSAAVLAFAVAAAAAPRQCRAAARSMSRLASELPRASRRFFMTAEELLRSFSEAAGPEAEKGKDAARPGAP